MRKFYLFFAFFVLIASSFAQSTDLVPFQDANGKWGYKNDKGEIVITPQYKFAGYFNEEYAVVSQERHVSDGSSYDVYGYINNYGELVIDLGFTYAGPFHDGRAKVGKGDNDYKYTKYYGFIDKYGEVVIPLIYTEIGEFSKDGIATARYKDKEGFINQNGERIIDFVYDFVFPFGDNGLAAVERKGKYGYINKEGHAVIDFVFDVALPFSEGLAVVGYYEKIKDKKGTGFCRKYSYGYINEKGEKIIPIKYAVAESFGNNGLACVGISDVFDNKGLGCYTNIKYGYINKKGLVEIDFLYDYATSFDEGLAAVVSLVSGSISGPPYNVLRKGSGKLGFIDDKGNTIIPFDTYDFSYNLDEIKEKLRIFINGWSNEGYYVRCGYSTWLKKNGKWGAIGMNGAQKVDFQFDDCFKRFLDVVEWSNSMKKYSHDRIPFIEAVRNNMVSYFDMYGNEYKSEDELRKKTMEDNRERYDFKNADNQKPFINWSDTPSSTGQQLFALNAQIKSDSKIAYCTVYLNGSPIAEDFAPGGSHVANDIKETDNYNFTISKTLALKEGKNTIRIKVGNAGGVTDESREITYTPIKQPVAKPAIAWGDIPERTTSSKLVVTAEVTSESAIASCDLYLEGNCDGTKGSHIAPDIIEGQEKGKLSKTMSRTFTLCEGENNIVAEATNAAGMTKVVKKVIYEKPEPPAIAWDGIVPENTTKATLEVKATIASKTDVTWRIMKSSSSKTKGSNVAADIIENVVASGKGNNVNGKVTLSPGYNTITIEATNAYERKTVSKKVWHSPCEKRIALVIGNANYRRVENLGRFGKLQNPINDAISIYKELESCGFDMMPIVKNANLKTMQESINAFIDKANKEHYEVAFIYYSGHGVSPSIEKREKQESFFIPLIEEDSIAYIEDLAKYAIDANRLIEDLNNKTDCRIKIAMLDCCRSCNLASRAKGPMALKGMNPLNVPFGEQIFFAARYKEAALDYINRDDTNSPFVTAFLQCFREYPNYKWEDLVKKVILKVHELTGTYQEPKAEGTLKGDFYLNPYHDKP